MQRLVHFQLSFIVILILAFSPMAKAVTTLVYPKQNMNVADTSFQLMWDVEPGAVSYDIQVSRNINFSIIDFSSAAVTANTVTVPNLAWGNYYYWRVRANSPLPGAWSATGKFAHF